MLAALIAASQGHRVLMLQGDAGLMQQTGMAYKVPCGISILMLYHKVGQAFCQLSP